MKLVLNLSLFLFPLFIFSNEALSLTESQIKRICTKEKRKSICLKNLREKKYKLQNGKVIEIPVIPYKR